ELTSLLSLVPLENEECYKFAMLCKDEGEEVAKRNRASIFSLPMSLTAKQNYKTLNLFVTNAALSSCKSTQQRDVIAYLDEFVLNIRHSKTLSDLLGARNERRPRRADSTDTDTDKDKDTDSAPQALPFSLRYITGVGSKPARYATGRYDSGDRYDPGSPRHLVERLLNLRSQIDLDVQSQLRMEGNNIISETQGTDDFPTIHSRAEANKRMFYYPMRNIKGETGRPGGGRKEGGRAEDDDEEYVSDFDDWLDDGAFSAQGRSEGAGKDREKADREKGRFLEKLRLMGDELVRQRYSVASQLNLTVHMLNASYHHDRQDYLRRLEGRVRYVEGMMEDVSGYSTAEDGTDTLHIASQGFSLDDTSDLYFLLDPETDGLFTSTSSIYSPGTAPLSQSDLSELENVGLVNRKGWRQEDGSQVQTAEKGERQKVGVSLMDPPRNKPPPPPPAPRDGFGDGRREEDESNRRRGDDRDIGFCGIEEFYKLGPGASVRSVGTTTNSEDGLRYMCLQARLATAEVVRRWVIYDDAINFLEGGMSAVLEAAREAKGEGAEVELGELGGGVPDAKTDTGTGEGLDEGDGDGDGTPLIGTPDGDEEGPSPFFGGQYGKVLRM
ncbi:hypothetical protein B484DRAFT_450246, partial [Ochromonadaceae sp. CCMP2298]